MQSRGSGALALGNTGHALKARALVLTAIATLLLALPIAAAEVDEPLFGVWANPQDSVHVRIEPCDDRICGIVVWASDKAVADAARGGTPRLVGQGLFRDFISASAGQWRGRVFVPDVGRTFSGTLRLLDDDRLEAKGCLTRRLGCRTQVWTRRS